jgi:hypothetical protein
MVQKLDDLGLRINLQTYCFLLIIDTVVFKKKLTEEKMDKIISLGMTHHVISFSDSKEMIVSESKSPLLKFKAEILFLSKPL